MQLTDWTYRYLVKDRPFFFWTILSLLICAFFARKINDFTLFDHCDRMQPNTIECYELIHQTTSFGRCAAVSPYAAYLVERNGRRRR